MMKNWLAFLLLLPFSAGAEFCADLKAKYGTGIMRCVDFAAPIDAAMNSQSPTGTATIGTQLFNGSVTATPGSTGTLHWQMKSLNQVKAEQPNLSPGTQWITAIQSNNYKFQRWIGVDKLTPGQTYYYQFKLRFNKAFKTQWGGGGPKIFGMDAGCRTINGVQKPKICENYTDFSKGFTTMGTASSLEFATMTTMNWAPATADVNAEWAYPILYQGSANWGGTVGFTPPAFVDGSGVQLLEQAGPDVGLVWDDAAQQFRAGTTCDNWTRASGSGYGNKPQHVAGTGPCVTYGAPDVWHEITVAFRPSGNFYDTNPAATTNRTYRHDSMFKAWYDGQLIVNFDPDEAPFRTGQPSKAECASIQSPHPAYDNCRTGIDIYKDSRDVNANPDYESFDADVTQFILWTFNYRRGYAYPGWCDANIPAGDPYLGLCRATEGSGESATSHPQFDAFLTHSEVNVYMDDWVVATVPLPMSGVELGAPAPARSFGDANQHGLTGSWYNPATNGQGILLEVYPNLVAPGTGFLHGGWFTFKDPASDSQQRWYSISGHVPAGQASANLTIYQNVGGNFDSLPATSAVPVGTAVLSFANCTSAMLTYAFTDGSHGSGAIPLTRLTPNVTCSPDGGNFTNAEFGYSGNWFDPATSGQGFIFELNPNAAVFFFGWYTYGSMGQSPDAAGQRWYTGEANYVSGARTLPVTLYETCCGAFNEVAATRTTAVGEATVAFHSCHAASLTFSFTGGSNAGASGTIRLTRAGPAPPGCGP